MNAMKAVTEPGRLNAVEKSSLLDAPEEPVFNEITASICKELQAPISLISIVGADRQFFKSQQGMPADLQRTRQTSFRQSLCMYVVGCGHTLSIENLKEDPSFEQHAVIDDFKVLAYLGEPLIYMGEIIGSVCALDNQPRKWSENDIKYLKEASASVQAELYYRNLNAFMKI